MSDEADKLAEMAERVEAEVIALTKEAFTMGQGHVRTICRTAAAEWATIATCLRALAKREHPSAKPFSNEVIAWAEYFAKPFDERGHFVGPGDVAHLVAKAILGADTNDPD